MAGCEQEPMISEDIEWINALRRAEIEEVLDRLPELAGDLLEIGGGSGQQALLLSERGFRVTSIDLASSEYRAGRVFPVQDYDGRHIPFPDASFDVIFSSNTLEHIAHLDDFEGEMLRVLRSSGRAVHILPTEHWRLWTWVTHYPGVVNWLWRLRRRGERAMTGPDRPGVSRGSLLRKGLVPPRHGERGNTLTEYRYFRRRWWSTHFERCGWRIVKSFDLGLFYTGYMLAHHRLPLTARRRLARLLGAACRCFVLVKERA
jgi:SAM-dependent methyltransferase